MSTEVSATWPKGWTRENVERRLSPFRTDVFINKAVSNPRPYIFHVATLPNRRALTKAIALNGGKTVAAANIDSADVIIDFEKTAYANSHSDKAVCLPKFIAECLEAGCFLDVAAYDPEYAAQSSSRNVSIDASASSSRRPVAALEEHSQASSDEQEEALDAEDRYVDELLSSQSRNIAEYPSHMIDSPGAQSNVSAAMSDNDFRIKQYLDTHSRNLRALNGNGGGWQQHRSAGVARSFGIKQQSQQQQHAQRPASQQSQGSRVSNMVERLTSPPPPSSQDTGNAQFKRTVRIPGASKSFQAARQVFESSSPVLDASVLTKTNSFSPSSKRRSDGSDALRGRRQGRSSPRRQRLETRVSSINTQEGDSGNLSDLDNMGESLLLDASPELRGSGIETIAISRLFEPSDSRSQMAFAHASQPVRNATDIGVSAAESDDIDTVDLGSSSDENYPDPSSFLAPRHDETSSMSPELGSPQTAVAQNQPNFRQPDGPSAFEDVAPVGANDISARSSGSKDALAKANDHARELAHVLSTPGKRRRIGNDKEEYDRDAMPMTIDKSHNLVRADKALRRLSDSSMFKALPVGTSHSSESAQPRIPLSEGAKRHQVKAGSRSSSKRIRMSSGDSPDPSLNPGEYSSEVLTTTAVSLARGPSSFTETHLQMGAESSGALAPDNSPAVLALQSSQPMHPLSAPALSNVSDSHKIMHIPQTPDDSGFVAATEIAAREVAGALNDKDLSIQPGHKNEAESSADNSFATEDNDDGDYEFVDASEEQPRSRSQSLSLSQPQGDTESSLSSEAPEQRQQSMPKTISLSLRDSDDESDRQEAPSVSSKAPRRSVSAHDDGESSDSFEYTDDSNASVTEMPATIPKENFAENEGSDRDEGEVEDVELEDEEKEKARGESAQIDLAAKNDASIDTSDKPEAVDAPDASSEPDTERVLPSDSDSDFDSDSNSDPDFEAEAGSKSGSDTASVPETAGGFGSSANSGSAMDSERQPAVNGNAVPVADVASANEKGTKGSDSGEEIIEKWAPAVDVFDKEWDSCDAEVPLNKSTGRLEMPALTSSHPGPQTRARSKALHFDRPSSGDHSLDLHASRKRRMSSSRRLSMCQRLLQLQLSEQSGATGKGGPSGGANSGLGIMLDSSALELGKPGAGDVALATSDSVADAGASMPPSPARRATFSGTMRVFGESEPELSDGDRLQYMRRVKGLMEGTKLSAREALKVLYFCTGDWVNARKHILLGPESVSAEFLWNSKDDDVLLQGHSARRMEELRQRRGKVEVYRRLQFLNTFHGSGSR